MSNTVFRPIIAIDFDGTIKENPNYLKMGKMADNCKEVLERLKEAGCRLILWTCRSKSDGSLEGALKYLKDNEIYDLFEKFNENVDGLPFESKPKILADFYLDDKNILGFPGFLECEKIIMQHPYFKVGEQNA